MNESHQRRYRILLPALLVVGLVTIACGACPLATSLQRQVQEVETVVTRVVEVVASPTPQPAQAPAPTPEPSINTEGIDIIIQPGADVETEILNAVYTKVNPSVVNIGTDTGQGSGFVWNNEGHIVTNAHVVQGAQEIYVTFDDGVQVPADVVGEDPNSDLAVVVIDPDLHDLVPVELGDIDAVNVGDRAIAIGNPFAHQNTMTQGIISAKGRSIQSITQYQIPEALQTDAAINPGNSGGPLLDSEGRVIGINAQIDTGSSMVRVNAGIGFAIPVNIAVRVIPALIEDGQYEHPYLGLTGLHYSPVIWEEVGLDPLQRGAYVTAVSPGGPSDQAGIEAGTRSTGESLPGGEDTEPLYSGGDLIIAIGNRPVQDFDDLLIYLFRNASPGDVVVLTVVRDSREIEVPVTLGVRPGD